VYSKDKRSLKAELGMWDSFTIMSSIEVRFAGLIWIFHKLDAGQPG
jgi:hypothetical protein